MDWENYISNIKRNIEVRRAIIVHSNCLERIRCRDQKGSLVRKWQIPVRIFKSYWLSLLMVPLLCLHLSFYCRHSELCTFIYESRNREMCPRSIPRIGLSTPLSTFDKETLDLKLEYDAKGEYGFCESLGTSKKSYLHHEDKYFVGVIKIWKLLSFFLFFFSETVSL